MRLVQSTLSAALQISRSLPHKSSFEPPLQLLPSPVSLGFEISAPSYLALAVADVEFPPLRLLCLVRQSPVASPGLSAGCTSGRGSPWVSCHFSVCCGCAKNRRHCPKPTKIQPRAAVSTTFPLARVEYAFFVDSMH